MTSIRLVPLALTLALLGACGQHPAPPRPPSPPAAALEEGPREAEPERPDWAPDLEVAWRWEAPSPGSVGPPAVDGDGVAVTHSLSSLVLLRADGTVAWEVDVPHLRDVPPALTPEVVVAATEDGLVAVDRASGTPRWRVSLPDRANGPVVVDGTVVTTTWRAGVWGVGLDDGRPRWQTLAGPLMIGGPAAGPGSVAVTWEDSGGAPGGVAALDAGSGEVRWQHPLPGQGVGGAAVTGGDDPLVVLVSSERRVVGHALADGRRRWAIPTAGRGSPEVPPTALPGGVVLAADRLGSLTLVEPDGRVAWARPGAGAAVRGGPVGPAPGGWFLLPVDDGTLLLSGPGHPAGLLDPPGRVSGVASLAAPAGHLALVATREAGVNALEAWSGW